MSCKACESHNNKAVTKKQEKGGGECYVLRYGSPCCPHPYTISRYWHVCLLSFAEEKNEGSGKLKWSAQSLRSGRVRVQTRSVCVGPEHILLSPVSVSLNQHLQAASPGDAPFIHPNSSPCLRGTNQEFLTLGDGEPEKVTSFRTFLHTSMNGLSLVHR